MTPPADRPAALLLDMDGTLTEPMLDFPLIKRELGIGNRPILEALAAMGPEEREIADAILLRHEDAAAQGSTLADGCFELLDWLEKNNFPFAVITRNSRRSLSLVFEKHGLTEGVTVTRDDAVHKPDPTPLRLAAERLGVDVRRCWMVGDGKYDVEAGNAAGCPTIWLSLGRSERPFPAEPWRTVTGLRDVLAMLEACKDDAPQPEPGSRVQ